MPTYESIIQHVVDEIEVRLGEDLKFTDLAKLSSFSDFHFHRVFQSIAGLPVMEYVRKRRLVHAAYSVAHTDEKLLDIALNYGFGTPETFIRAFRKMYGITPSEYRKRGFRPPVYAKVNVLERRFNPYLGGIRMNYEIVTKPSFTVIGYSIRTRNADGQNTRDIPAFWSRYMQEGLGKRLYEQASSNAEYGICDDFDMESGEFSYIIGVQAKEGAEAPEGTVTRHYPEQTYAVFTTPQADSDHFTDSIQNTWTAIFSEWFPHSSYEHAGAAEFEYYDERCWRDRNTLLEMDIYIPVKRKEEA
ncbi:AraC family transcriptional regulator [Paenibacillus radicis (ex Gao et al. 2016)]|uniref:AraC family transcriptional regulator n=1 Tax=Paenibacillus radicis (ex Gao et al. 2016) TaxID=1737354 RepID=A0A917H1L1_9BACL|nr:effector binding domain-containing protein [Paenibacillus radicis (ex Gao et al. 2016)]GGG64569.1 AraC family transcriptional regulator [Paenibacillus radicis (ex Gao et al. 2016)]